MNKQTFCSLPFTEIFLGPDSEIKTCCSSRRGLGNLKNLPIDEVLKGHLAREIRKSIINGEWHPACSQCKEQEKQGALSERKDDIELFSQNTNLDENFFQLRRLDLRWSNVCNLSCVYCYEYFSSKWAQIKGIKVNSLENINEESIFKLIESNKEHINNVMLLGGEPLLQKQNLRLLDTLPNVGVYILSNLSLDFNTNSIANKLLNRQNVNWGVSFETVQEKYEYVRRGASWDVFCNNINKLSSNQQTIEAHSMYSIYSAFNLVEFFEFLEKNHFNKVYWNLLQSTGYTEDKFNVLGLPARLKDLAISEIDRCYNLYRDFPGIESLLDYKNSLIENYNLDYTGDIISGIDKIEKMIPYKYSYKDLWFTF